MNKPKRLLSDGTTVKTNLVPRPMIDWYGLSNEEKKGLDYVDTVDKQDGFVGFRFKGQVWDLEEFTTVDREGPLGTADWDGVSAQSAFHGVVVSVSVDGEQVVVGQVFS